MRIAKTASATAATLLMTAALLGAAGCSAPAAQDGETAEPATQEQTTEEAEPSASSASKITDTSLPFESGYEGEGAIENVPSSELTDLASFTLLGASYSLPCDMAAFTENGWEIDSSSGYQELESMTAAPGPVMVCDNAGFEKDDLGLTLHSENRTDSTVPWTEFTVTSAEVSNASSGIDISDSFSTAKGLSVGDTVRTAIELYGDPSFVAWNSDGTNIYFMQWDFDAESGSDFLSVTLEAGISDEGTIDSITIDAAIKSF